MLRFAAVSTCAYGTATQDSGSRWAGPDGSCDRARECADGAAGKPRRGRNARPVAQRLFFRKGRMQGSAHPNHDPPTAQTLLQTFSRLLIYLIFLEKKAKKGE